jgi:carboxylate-amine ligase
MDALTRAGIPYTFKNWDNYNKLVTDLHNAGLITDVRDIWWDVRPHPDLGTVEVRICDLPVTFTEILAVAAFIQALVKTLAESPEVEAFPRLEIIANNKWQAARHGLRGKFIDLTNISTPLTIVQAIENTLAFSRNASQALHTQGHIDNIHGIIRNGTGADKIRKYLSTEMTFIDCIRKLYGDFWT